MYFCKSKQFGMSNNYFKFKQFVVNQHLCAMKVGTDGTLLGSWTAVSSSGNILDIGTGTGLIALMLAQRASEAHVTAIDIDDMAVRQAKENVQLSPWSGRIEVIHSPLQGFRGGQFDTIVCNPPYFNDSLKCPDTRRNTARHTDTLSYSELLSCSASLLCDDGELSVIIPSDCYSSFISAACLSSLFLSRRCAVRTRKSKPVKRYLLSFRKHSVPDFAVEEQYIEDEDGRKSEWYKNLTEDFYL